MYLLFTCLCKMWSLVEICMRVCMWLFQLAEFIVCPQNSSRFSTLEDNISTLPVRSDVRLVPQSSEDLVYDINSAPLFNFHHYERLQQKVTYEVNIYFVFIEVQPKCIFFVIWVSYHLGYAWLCWWKRKSRKHMVVLK